MGRIARLRSVSGARLGLALALMAVVLSGLSPQDTATVTNAQAAAGGTWLVKARLPEARAEAGVVEAGGKVYLLGGKSDEAGYFSSVPVYDPAADSWGTAAP